MSDEYRKDPAAIEALSAEQYYVTQQNGTELPFTGEYVHTKADGTYVCAACGSELFK